MPSIPQSTIDAIKHKASIETVIGHYIPVIKKGNSYRAVCPFHDDHDPSLNISVDKQIFKCFVCGMAGDVFSFVEKFEHVDYVTAIKKVADLVGVPLDITSYRHTETFKVLPEHKALKDAVLFCQHELTSVSGQEMMAYLKKRQIPDAFVEKYELGYNPGQNALYNFLQKKGYKDDVLVSAGLCRLTTTGMTDIFARRLMIPIHDRLGHPIGFTARTLDPQALAKYINTADTPLFHKSDVIFNWHRANEAAREKGFAILAEGPMDVMALDKAGYSNAVCTMGTNATKNQLAALKQLALRLVLAYDGDNAGQQAIFKFGQLALSAGLQVNVIRNTTDLDPDEILTQRGFSELQAMIEHPYSWMEFIISYGQKHYDFNDYESRKAFAQLALAQLNQLTDAFDRENWQQQISTLTGFSVSSLKLLPQSNEPKVNTAATGKPKPVIRPHLLDGQQLAEMTIIHQMLMAASAANTYKDQLNGLCDKRYTELARLIMVWYTTNETLDLTAFSASLPDDEMRTLLVDIESEPLVNASCDTQILADAINKIRISRLDDQIRGKMQQMRQYQDPVIKARIAEELNELNRQKLILRTTKKEKGGTTND